MPLPDLHNEYWLLRHGRSKANEAETIVSKLENGVSQEWSLADAGKEQARHAGLKFKEGIKGRLHPGRQVRCYASPFSRTLETAQLAVGQLVEDGADAPAVEEALELRERYFGAGLELQSYKAAYGNIWEHDVQDANFRPGGDGESVAMVAERIKGLFKRLEEAHRDAIILLVSHGDTLSITHAAMRGHDVRQHRQFAFDTAELRWLNSAL